MKKDVFKLALQCVPEDEEVFNVSDVARYANCTEYKIRNWHHIGMFDKDTRSGSGRYRKFSIKDMYRAKKINELRENGLSLKVIKFILDNDNSEDIDELDEQAN